MKKNKWIIWVSAIVILGIVFWIWKSRETKGDITLETVMPTMGDISTTITATGTVQPVDTVAVGTQVSGTINKVYADFNSVVKKGQLLAQLDPTILQAQADNIAANLQQMQNNFQYQQINYNRQMQLYKVGAISKADLDLATNQYNTSRDNVAASQAQLTSAKRSLFYTNIYSPIDGTVVSRNVSEGQTVAASFSTPTLFSIAKDLTKMQVRASIDEADIGNVKEGQPVTFTVDAFPDRTFKGSVAEVRLHPTVSANVVYYVTIINTSNADLSLKPGMTASISVSTQDIPNAMKIPAKAIAFKPDSLVVEKYNVEGMKKGSVKGGKKKNAQFSAQTGLQQSSDSTAVVWVLQNNNLLKKHIKIGLNNETEVQVVSGLAKTDQIVTGYQSTGTGNSKSGPAKSPFMPQRGGGKKTSGGSGGGPGGGGPR